MGDAFNVLFWGILTFSILVVIHEGGHFFAARAFGVRVHEFMVGLPGPAIRYHAKETAYGITAIPLGGYVKIAGMEPGPIDELLPEALSTVVDSDRIFAEGLAADMSIDRDRAASLLFTLSDWGAIKSDENSTSDYLLHMHPAQGESDQEFYNRVLAQTYKGLSAWKRITVLSMGVLINLLTAIIVFTIVLSTWGYYEQTLTLDAVLDGGAAQAAGIMAGDTLTSFDDEPVNDWMDLIAMIDGSEPGETVVVGVERDGQSLEKTVILGESETGGAYMGVQTSVEKVELTVFGAALEAVTWTGMVFAAIISFFNPATFSQAMEGARGVVGISIEAAEAVKNGPLDYAWLIALLSLSLGVMNILPIPPLDGGKIVLEVIEKLRGRPLDRSVALGASLAGAVLLFSFIGYVMYADFVRYF